MLEISPSAARLISLACFPHDLGRGGGVRIAETIRRVRDEHPDQTHDASTLTSTPPVRPMHDA